MNRTFVAWLSLAAPAAGLLACGTSARVETPTVKPYTITGRTIAEFRAELDRLGPIDHGVHVDALTHWDVFWRWPTASDGSCILSQATVRYAITITAPAWTPGPGVDPPLVVAWSKYMTALATQKGHVDFVAVTVPSVLQALHAATCATANAAAIAVLDRIRQHDIDYDAATNHGATQGATFG